MPVSDRVSGNLILYKESKRITLKAKLALFCNQCYPAL